ncbi:MAG TPA: hypothetical protein VGP62_26935 [Bryobacteraceae bacterium]|nr:hypothetical protein [Bryobacteraceae bacterium]
MSRALLLLAIAGSSAWAHIGSPDVFFEGSAGPYPLFVTIRPPSVIPGVAQIEIRCPSPDLRKMLITPIPLAGEASRHSPTPDVMTASKYDPRFFTGSFWIMETGSWQVRIQADGARGPGRLSVPVAAVANRTKSMNLALGGILFALMVTLIAGLVSIAGAGVREAQLEPGAKVPPEYRRRARIAMAATAVLMVAILYLGNLWWRAEASDYSRYLYKALQMKPSLDGSKLILELSDPGWIVSRRLDDFVPDHNHLMHLYVIQWPEMDRVWHLHPEMEGTGRFRQQLPDMPRGHYKLYADVVHADGFPETLAADFNFNADVHGQPLSGDDAAGTAGPTLADGFRMVWDRDPGPLQPKKLQLFRFHIEDSQARVAHDLELYMGMAGHAAFVRSDGAVFAHIHPSGTVAMPALALADPARGMNMDTPPSEVAFPYGFPGPGRYRIIVQLKRAGTVETGLFDALVQ